MRSTCFAQNIDSTVEVRLQLIHQISNSNSKVMNGTAISVSIINHLNKDVYIPGFSWIGVHFYDNSAGFWQEINLGCNKYYIDSIPYSKGGRRPCQEIATRNDIAKYYINYVYSLRMKQRDILYNCLGKDIYKILQANIYGDHLFLKANEVIDNYHVISIENLFMKQTQYRISFNTGTDDKLIFNKNKADLFPPCPEKLLKYQIYTPNKLISNTLYFSNIDFDSKY